MATAIFPEERSRIASGVSGVHQVMFEDEFLVGRKGDEDGESDISSLSLAPECPVLKSAATSVQRSKDYADKLETVIDRLLSEKASGSESKEEQSAGGVLKEISRVVQDLEEEKKRVVGELKAERVHVGKLQRRLDMFVEKRLKELPYAVQREHEACSADIVELQWHVAFKTRQETRVKAKLALAEQLNDKLKSDMEFVRENNPLLSEKLDMENTVIIKLLDAHNKTATQLMKTLKDQENAEQESEKAEEKAAKERNYLKKELDGVKKTLDKALKDQQNAEKKHAQYIRTIEETKQYTIDTEEQTTLQVEKLDNIKKLEELQQAKVNDLQEKFEEASSQNQRLKDELDEAEKEAEESKKRRDQERVTLEAYVANNDRKYRKMLTENRNIKFENQDLEEQLETNKEQRDKDQKALDRLRREMDRNEQTYEQMRDEFHETEVKNKNLATKVVEVEEKTRVREEMLDDQIETLGVQVREEVSKRGQLQSKISAEKGNLVSLDFELKKQEEKMQKKAEEVKKAVEKVKGQVEKMSEKNEVRQKQLSELLAALEKLRNIHNETETKLSGKKSKLKPKLEQLKADDLALSKQLDQMDYVSENLTGELREMKLGAVHLNKVIRTTKNDIEDFTIEISENEHKITDKKALIQRLEKSLEEVSNRFKEKQAEFKDLSSERKGFLTKMQVKLERLIRENQELAKSYYSQQQKCFAIKNDLNQVLQQQIELEQTHCHLNQIRFFQEKFLFALSEYYKYRELFFEAELESITYNIEVNDQSLYDIRIKMESTLQVMKSFLHGIMDGTLFRAMKEEKMEEMEIDKEEQCDAHKKLENINQFKVLPPITTQETPALQNSINELQVC